MTNEKQLLLKDLCARLPYGVKIHAEFNGEVYDEELQIVNKSAMLGDYGPVPVVNSVEYDINDGFELINVKPYLRPMSSMTEEEKSTYMKLHAHALPFSIVEWLDKNHFDHRTNKDGEHLIEIGLALEAPTGMYKAE